MNYKNFLTVENPTLKNARAFFYHNIGCNKLFTGTGFDCAGICKEFIYPNCEIDTIKDVVRLKCRYNTLDIDNLSKI